MQSEKSFISVVKLVVSVAVVFSWVSVFPSPGSAQTGKDAVYTSSGTNVASPTFIDASQFISSTYPDLCSVVYGILSGTLYAYPSTGAVVDTRNISGSALTCASGTPWYNGTIYLSNVRSTILLPAGTIVIGVTWILPSNTHVIGEGDANPSGGTPGTTIQPSSAFATTAGPFIQFGSSSSTGISVERLTLDGLGASINGILNAYAGDASFVDHVSLYQIRGTGLLVEGSANNSGPYSNTAFDTGSFAGVSSTVCAQINGLSGTHGIHGLSCTSESNDANAAVLLDSSNNSIEDVRIAGFYDGIRVGANANAQSNVLINIIGDTAQRGERLAAQFHVPAWATS